MSAPQYVVYWQPGCTSCLKAKEFLQRHGIAFESINVRADAEATAKLAALGARSIPVIARGSQWVHAQDLEEVARFLGVAAERTRLPAATLVVRIQRLLAAASRFTQRLPEQTLETCLPGRPDRTGIDLAFHIPMIVTGFLEAARGGRLTFEHFERRPAGNQRVRTAVVEVQTRIAAEFQDWWVHSASTLPASVDTYYGRQLLAGVLERTAWHVAQHVRQLESLALDPGSAAVSSLTDLELEGLPLPEGLWDPEIRQPS